MSKTVNKVNAFSTQKRSIRRKQVYIVAVTFFLAAIVIFLTSRITREIEKTATEQFNQQQLVLARSAAAGIELWFRVLDEEL
ncbi:hypothetical protein KA005_01480, partial [bacterium]|nr:hypothetical protein [bacterium]